MFCPICKTKLDTDFIGLFCSNKECCYISEIPTVANEEDIIPLLYENEKLIKWIKIYDNIKKWYLNGQLHREDGPAVEYADGSNGWYVNGKLHREDGPAIKYADGSNGWYVNGKLHREDGPAVEYINGTKDGKTASRRWSCCRIY